MEELTLLNYMRQDYKSVLPKYQRMKRYYDGKHDIYNSFIVRQGTADRATHINWISKFISEEIAYALNKPVSYISLSGDSSIISAIYKAYEHFDLNHDQTLMRELEVYGICYCLYYIDSKGRFSERILNPTNAIAYCDDEGNVLRFIHFYRKQYDTNYYYDVYYPGGKVDTYINDSFLETGQHYFSGVPVHVCHIEESETIYAKIKELNDDYNELVSNQQSLISEFKNAYLTICNEKQDVSVDFLKEIQNGGAKVIVYPYAAAKPSWLIKEINDTAIKNQMDELKQNLYAQSGHIDFNEKLSSNLSGVALQSRLTGLDQRVNFMLNPVKNALYERIYFLCEYFQMLNQIFDPSDIKIEANIDIPTDTAGRIQEVVQAGDILSLRTKLERIPFVENPEAEIQRMKQEQADSRSSEKQYYEDFMNRPVEFGDE